jgi:hypothetical protein
MGSLGPTHLIALLLAVAIAASTTGFIASAAMQRKKRHARRFLAVGFLCGLMAGAILRSRRRGLTTVSPRAFTVAASHLRPAMLATGLLTRMRRTSLPERK